MPLPPSLTNNPMAGSYSLWHLGPNQNVRTAHATNSFCREKCCLLYNRTSCIAAFYTVVHANHTSCTAAQHWIPLEGTAWKKVREEGEQTHPNLGLRSRALHAGMQNLGVQIPFLTRCLLTQTSFSHTQHPVLPAKQSRLEQGGTLSSAKPIYIAKPFWCKLSCHFSDHQPFIDSSLRTKFFCFLFFSF